MVNKERFGVFDLINTILIMFITISTLYPFVNLLFVSVSPIKDVISNTLMLYPKNITFEAYSYVLKFGRLGSAFNVTLTITIVGSIINLGMTSLGAYVLSDKDLPGRNILAAFIVLTMVFHGGLIPTYMVIRSYGLVDTIWALMLPNAINTFWMLLMRNFFQTIPISLRESARIDGYSEFKIWILIILPLSLPIICTLLLFYGVMHWNDYYNAIIYTNKQALQPLQVVIRGMYVQAVERFDENIPPAVETVRAATIILCTLPILLLYPSLQKYFAQGIMVGAIKG